ncbi:hypothetical protein AYO20_02486 [Fonsecaea nubica]|uniref:Uncharacterized protein n=1 Tax=Fonsecaea nubica TaxID=856822 RepID=A0A178D9J8_9EURO|nr:hypothetical protein AYO20_02486 [Fonsecaea nubica]OAL38034.1 hypothetical protein AYO20_02486 [Fonsecaea nubica]
MDKYTRSSIASSSRSSGSSRQAPGHETRFNHSQSHATKKTPAHEPEIIVLSDSDEESPSDQTPVGSPRVYHRKAVEYSTGNDARTATAIAFLTGTDTNATGTYPGVSNSCEPINDKVATHFLINATRDGAAASTDSLKAIPSVRNVNTAFTTNKVDTTSPKNSPTKTIEGSAAAFDF